MQPQRRRQPVMVQAQLCQTWKGRAVPGFWGFWSLFTEDQSGMLAEVLVSISAASFAPSQWGCWGRDVRKTCSLSPASLCTAIIHAGNPMLGDMGSGTGNV